MNRLVLAALCVAGACVTPKPVVTPPEKPQPVVAAVPSPEDAARTVLLSFLEKAEQGAFEQVLPLLSKPLRERYQPQTLARDFGAEPLARQRLEGIRKHAKDAITVDGATARLEWAQARRVQWVQEDGQWRIAALE